MLQIPLDIPNKGDFPQIKAADRKMIAYAVLMGVSNQEAFMRFHPEYLRPDCRGLNETGVQESRQFWGWGKVKDYRAEYEKTVQNFISAGKQNTSTLGEPISDNRKERALKSLLNQAMSMVEGGTELDADTLKTVTEIFKKLNILKDEVERGIKPIRYLPELCFSACRYRLFVESAVKNGDIIDECQYCRALQFARENGFKCDNTNMLNIPKEVLDAEPGNTVTTLDIIDGKVDN